MARLPTSTIVLAVATCIPFALAIKDTTAGTYELDDDAALASFARDDDADDEGYDDDDDYRDVAERRALEALRHRQELAEYEASKERERRERHERITALYATEVAMLGSAFEGIHLGQPTGITTVESSPDAYLMLIGDGVRDDGLQIQLHRWNQGDCDWLESGLRETWGEPVSRHDRWIWTNARVQQRAIWTESDCELVVEKVATAEQWIDRSDKSLIPLWAIGKPAKQLLDALGARTANTIGDDQIAWSVRGLGVGRNFARVVADVAGGKVTSLFVSLEIDGDTVGALSSRISTLAGKEPEIASDRPDVEVWKTRPRFELVEGAPQTFLTIGTRP